MTRTILRQVGLNQRAFWRNPESAFFNFAMPLGVLLIFGATSSDTAIPGHGGAKVMTLFVPGILAFGVVVVAYGNLAANISLQRADGVLKRLRTTPLSPLAYLGGQLANTLVTTLLIAVATIALGAVAFGALPRASAAPELIAVLALGIACFAALGLAISAAIRSADAAGAITNGTYLPLAMVSGMFSANLHLPHLLDAVVSAFPLKALADGLRAAYDPSVHHAPLGAAVVLALWSVAGVASALRWFQWEPSR